MGKMVVLSSDLTWQLVRNNSSFIKKQKNLPVLTSEPNNLTGLNSFKFSGLCSKAVGLKVETSGEKKQNVTLTTKNRGSKLSKPAASVKSTGTKKCAKKGKEQLKVQLCKL